MASVVIFTRRAFNLQNILENFLHTDSCNSLLSVKIAFLVQRTIQFEIESVIRGKIRKSDFSLHTPAGSSIFMQIAALLVCVGKWQMNYFQTELTLIN